MSRRFDAKRESTIRSFVLSGTPGVAEEAESDAPVDDFEVMRGAAAEVRRLLGAEGLLPLADATAEEVAAF